MRRISNEYKLLGIETKSLRDEIKESNGKLTISRYEKIIIS